MLKQRIITAVLLAAFVLWALFTWPAPRFGFFLMLATAACAWEWSRLGNLLKMTHRIAYTIIATGSVAGLLFFGLGLLELIVPLALLVWLAIAVDLRRRPVIARTAGEADWSLLVLAAFLLITTVASLYMALIERSAVYVVYIVAVVAAADIGAYFAGKQFGRRKLAVRISQGKTIEGAIGGMLAATLLTVLALLLARTVVESGASPGLFAKSGLAGNVAVLFVASVLAALLSVVGDLFVSRAKRTVGVKDSGVLLPGHGGVLDRFDGLLAATPWLVMPLFWSN